MTNRVIGGAERDGLAISDKITSVSTCTRHESRAVILIEKIPVQGP